MKTIAITAKCQVVFTSSNYLHINLSFLFHHIFPRMAQRPIVGYKELASGKVYAFFCLLEDTISFIKKSIIYSRKFLLWEILDFQVQTFTLQ